MDCKYLEQGKEVLRLEVGQPVQANVAGAAVKRYSIELSLQELALVTLKTSGLSGSLAIIDSTGRRVKGLMIDHDGEFPIAFVAETAQVYGVNLDFAAAVGCYTLEWKRRLTVAEQIREKSKPRLEGRRITRLRRELNNDPGALELFWREIKRLGTPLLEENPDNPALALCTFLWRGAEQNVRVHLLFKTVLPNEYEMLRIEGTDVCYTTVQLPSNGRFAYRILVNTRPGPPPDMDSTLYDRLIFFASAQADPLNPRRCFSDSGSRYEEMSLLEMPAAPQQPWTSLRSGIACGSLKRYSLQSAKLGNNRSVTVYTPPGYSGQAPPYGLLLVFDEQWFLTRIPTATILDNLFADGKIPPLVAVLVGNGPGSARSRDLPCNQLWAAFIAEELVPWLRQNYNITGEPGRAIVTGASYGGLAAAYVALHYPEIFGGVLSQSGSFWWRPPAQTGQLHNFDPTQPNYMVSLFLEKEKLPLRFYLEAGSGEIDLTGNGRSILAANRHLRDVLLAKGYEVAYREFQGGHDFLSWRGTLAEGIMELTKGW